MLTAENKNELDALLASHEMTSCLLSPAVSDAAMLATVAQMARDGTVCASQHQAPCAGTGREAGERGG